MQLDASTCGENTLGFHCQLRMSQHGEVTAKKANVILSCAHKREVTVQLVARSTAHQGTENRQGARGDKKPRPTISTGYMSGVAVWSTSEESVRSSWTLV